MYTAQLRVLSAKTVVHILVPICSCLLQEVAASYKRLPKFCLLQEVVAYTWTSLMICKIRYLRIHLTKKKNSHGRTKNFKTYLGQNLETCPEFRPRILSSFLSKKAKTSKCLIQ